MAGRIENVQISCAGGEASQREAGALASLYGELLGMERWEGSIHTRVGKAGGLVALGPVTLHRYRAIG